MSQIIDPSYFKELAKADREILCRHPCCSFDEENRRYILNIWNWQYLINPIEATIGVAGVGDQPHEYLDLFSIYYLLKQGGLVLTGEWISEKDLVGGPTFFRGPHLVPTELISNRFGNDLKSFCTRCEELEGNKLQMADGSYQFDITPDIPIAVLYWVGDEDFPAEAKILYDRSISGHLTLDIVFALAFGICTRLGSS
ncbi:MAG: DUF3786 domain-containing protein [Desulforhopalus sp.]